MSEELLRKEYLELAALQAEYESELFSRPNVVGVAIGKRGYCLSDNVGVAVCLTMANSTIPTTLRQLGQPVN